MKHTHKSRINEIQSQVYCNYDLLIHSMPQHSFETFLPNNNILNMFLQKLLLTNISQCYCGNLITETMKLAGILHFLKISLPPNVMKLSKATNIKQ